FDTSVFSSVSLSSVSAFVSLAFAPALVSSTGLIVEELSLTAPGAVLPGLIAGGTAAVFVSVESELVFVPGWLLVTGAVVAPFVVVSPGLGTGDGCGVWFPLLEHEPNKANTTEPRTNPFSVRLCAFDSCMGDNCSVASIIRRDGNTDSLVRERAERVRCADRGAVRERFA